MAVRPSRGNDADFLITDRIHNHYFDFINQAGCEPSAFTVIFILVAPLCAVLVFKYLYGKWKGDTMLSEIDRGFPCVPLKIRALCYHNRSYNEDPGLSWFRSTMLLPG